MRHDHNWEGRKNDFINTIEEFSLAWLAIGLFSFFNLANR